MKFGTSMREDAGKTYQKGMQNASHAKVPGPGAYDHVHQHSTKTASPKSSFGGRLGKMRRASAKKQNVPGPGAYTASELLGDVASSTKKSAARARFGKADRGAEYTAPGMKTGRATVGPGFRYANWGVTKGGDSRKVIRLD